MKLTVLCGFITALVMLIGVNACSDHGVPINTNDGDSGNNGLVSFSATVHPLLLTHCGSSSCHTGETPQHGFSVESWNNVRRPVPIHGFNVIEGNAEASPMYIAVTSQYQTIGILYRMPKDQDSLSTADQNIIRDWINQGALDN